MKGLLLRVGIDKSFGQWNAPIDPVTNDFVYIPIPEDVNRFVPGLETVYDDFSGALRLFSISREISQSVMLPDQLVGAGCHLDPDFRHLTYGDQRKGRGNKIKNLVEGDFIVFFASLSPVSKCDHRLVYALIGIYYVQDIVRVRDIQKAKIDCNAHTRRRDSNPDDLVVFADPSRSGRFKRCVPIGSYRNKAYRVNPAILTAWGGLDIKDGFIQRSVFPPSFLSPGTFVAWLKNQNIELITANN